MCLSCTVNAIFNIEYWGDLKICFGSFNFKVIEDGADL